MCFYFDVSGPVSMSSVMLFSSEEKLFDWFKQTETSQMYL